MRERHVVVFALGPLLGKVNLEGRVPVTDILDGVVEGKTQVSGATFLHMGIAVIELVGLVGSGQRPPKVKTLSGAVKLVIEEGRPSAEVAKDLGICKETLRRWVKASTGQSDRQNREARLVKELEAEIKKSAQTGRGKGGDDRSLKKIRRHTFETVDEKYR